MIDASIPKKQRIGAGQSVNSGFEEKSIMTLKSHKEARHNSNAAINKYDPFETYGMPG